MPRKPRDELLHQPRRRRQIVLPPPPDIDLDEKCGRYFTYRDLIECGETWHRLAELHRRDPENHPYPDNVPRQLETYNAMRQLCEQILDPIREHFGSLSLTYAFASPWLTRHIKCRIAPQLDQHASWELGPLGRPVCKRGGMAADVLLPGRDCSLGVAWLLEQRSPVRVYLYGPLHPFHVALNSLRRSEVISVRRLTESGRVTPHRLGPKEIAAVHAGRFFPD